MKRKVDSIILEQKRGVGNKCFMFKNPNMLLNFGKIKTLSFDSGYLFLSYWHSFLKK